jgi:two-component system chemotaxis response regulator CheY
MHILVVEDDFISHRLLCRYLEPCGDCDVAVDGAEAVDAVRVALDAGSHYDLICLDIMMPGISGQEVLVQIRAMEQDHGLWVGMGAKVVMATALKDSQNVRQAFKASADGYVVKPIEKVKFYKTLEELGLKIPQTT